MKVKAPLILPLAYSLYPSLLHPFSLSPGNQNRGFGVYRSNQFVIPVFTCNFMNNI